jgi:hypothetical protein
LTPHPQAHALCADKRNLVLLSDEVQLKALGLPQATRDVLLSSIPRAERGDPTNAERVWAARRGFFFDPRRSPAPPRSRWLQSVAWCRAAIEHAGSGSSALLLMRINERIGS